MPGTARPKPGEKLQDKPWLLREYLPGAEEVSIGWVSPEGEFPLVYLKPGHPLLSTLRKTRRYSTPPSRKAPDMSLTIVKSAGRLCVDIHRALSSAFYQYVSSTGELGLGKDWCIVPDAARTEMLALLRRAKAEYRERSAKSAPSLRFAMDNGDIQVLQVVDPKAIRPHWRDPAIRDIEVYWKEGGAPPKSIKEMSPARGWLRGGEYEARYRYDPKIRTYYYRARWVYEDYALDRLDPPGKYGPWGPLLTTKQGPYVAPWLKTAGKKGQ
jgi:hypothetical protein